MEKRLGARLIEKNLITEEQLQEALERQKQFGGRLGQNLLLLGYISEDQLSSLLKAVPRSPKNIEDTGLGLSFIADLIIKHVIFSGTFTISEIVDKVKLPVSVVSRAIDYLRENFLVEVKGASGIGTGTGSFNYAITDKGKNHGAELLTVSRYIGPAPVTLDQYRNMVQMQTIRNALVNEETLKKAFSHLIISERLLHRLGPAISSGRAIFLYGPSGNGKTSIAETIGSVLPDNIFIPYAILVGGEIVVVFDPANHTVADSDADLDDFDQRWLSIRRPVVLAGGELTLKTLDLDFNPISKFYEAPLQMKANNGLFIVDDFGRQQIEPQALINRWIVPLERRTDLLTLHTGMKFEIPFDQLVVFSTNYEPKELVDAAFLRRIRYKIKIDHPSCDEFEAIFRKVCQTNGIDFNKEAFDHLIHDFYDRLDVDLDACHPRDITDQIVDEARYHGHPPQMQPENVAAAWENYFVEEQ